MKPTGRMKGNVNVKGIVELTFSHPVPAPSHHKTINAPTAPGPWASMCNLELGRAHYRKLRRQAHTSA
ncbi:hypothetical protein BD309DRAFT_851744 [Dichomitus squalens]|uniref:Uncharacterized protein n=1 Tax=Dichomitus squalens TaxID=114155 RepID=A0A4Q9P4Q4_9APHY|nr:hypothetical protein BD309DRAFT_851744 [Dichomitus squalens]TBU63991.1 hypothetical protein BD310DRAFT_461384 [Dichomitus squalens]